MEFANNWVYPWSTDMYDPVLKVRLSYSAGGPEPEEDDVSFSIYYDPCIEIGRYSSAVKPELRQYLGDRADDPIPFSSEQEKNILTMPNGIGAGNSFKANKEIEGTTLRIKMYRSYVPGNKHGLNALENLNYDIGYIKSGNYAVISQHPKEFLLYAFKNYINLPEVYPGGEWSGPVEGVRRIEMCLHMELMTKLFGLQLSNYPEVEPGWHCISAKELAQ